MNKGDKTVYQYGSFEPTLDPSYISLDNTFNSGSLEITHNGEIFLDVHRSPGK
jgi:hypothetical protein